MTVTVHMLIHGASLSLGFWEYAVDTAIHTIELLLKQ